MALLHQEIDQAAAALPLAVKAYALSSIGDGQGLLSLHRRSGLALVRVQVAFRTCDRALRILNEFWSDILPSLDDDLIAYAKEVRADTLMALVDVVVEERQSADKDGDEASLEAALLLKEAAELRSRLGEPSKHISTLKKLAMLYNRMGDIPARDKVAKECRLASNSWYASRSQIHHQQIQRFAHMQRICVNVGAAVAAS